MADLSPTTGESYYSGDWGELRDVLSVLNIDAGKMAKIDQMMVNRYQERVDRYIDGILGEVYHTPIRAMNKVMPNGQTVRVFPGDLRHAALYWTAGLLLMSEFQQLSQNMTEQMQTYMETAKRQIFSLRKFDHRMYGQDIKSNVSRTMPPALQPAAWPEQEI